MHKLTFNDGDSIPQLGLGTWKSAPGEVYEAIRAAIRIGYRHIDCAYVYGNEKEIGNAFRDSMKAGEVTREELFITSKLWNSFHKREDVLPALKESLEHLQLEYLDLYLIHWPVSIKKGKSLPLGAQDFYSPKEIPLIETWQGMTRCKEAGLAKHIGVSNFSTTHLNELIDAGLPVPEMNQVESHPYLNQKELIDFCQQHEMLVTAYSPLGSMDRSSNMKGEDEPKLLEDAVINQIAADHKCTPAQVILSWNLHRGVCVIPKSVHEGRLKENLNSGDIELSDSDMQKINSLNRDYRFVNGQFWTVENGPYTLEYLWE